MTRKQREFLWALAGTSAMLAMLWAMAAAARFSHDPGELMTLAFEQALGSPSTPADAPSARSIAIQSAPGASTSARRTVKADLLPSPAGATPVSALEVRLRRRAPVSTLASVTSPASSTRRRTTRTKLPQAHTTLTAPTAARSTNSPVLSAARIKVAIAPPPFAVRRRKVVQQVDIRDPAPPVSVGAQGEAIRSGAIINWMRNNPAILPDGIKRHVGWSAGALTSTVSLGEDDTAQKELFLLARPASQELHFVLVHGGRSYYFIDRGGRQAANKFRLGAAIRSQGVISGVTSEDRPLDSPEAETFFAAIVTWWRTIE